MSKLFQKLVELRDREVIEDIDLEFCRFLSNMDEDMSANVLLSACLVSFFYRQGDICISLDDHAGTEAFGESDLKTPELDAWLGSLQESSIVGTAGEFRPLLLDQSNRLYLHKFWHYEQTLSKKIIDKASKQPDNIEFSILKDGINRLFNQEGEEDNWQKIAAIAAVLNQFTVISGGPGTGKTTTVVRILALMVEQAEKKEMTPSIALAAPTGKAAARLEESVIMLADTLSVRDQIRDALPEKATTIHQLLGARRYSSQFRYNADNPLPYDVVIIDEASMIDQALMSNLTEALLDNCKLILLGDKDQLASVEAGSVLGDICAVKENFISERMAGQLEAVSVEIEDKNITQSPEPLTDNIILLRKNYRFDVDSGIAQLAGYINEGESEMAVSLLRDEGYARIGITNFADVESFQKQLQKTVRKYLVPLLTATNPREAFNHFKKFQLLSPHRRGLFGVDFLNREIEKVLIEDGIITRYEEWYQGKAVIINQNEYTLGLNNGDIGICMTDEEGEKMIYFEDRDGYHSVAPSRLPTHDLAYALTVHKSQGSEYDSILLVLPTRKSKVLTRELIYTAITRSRNTITVWGDPEIFSEAVRTTLDRASGLRELLHS